MTSPTLPHTAAILLYELLDAHEREAFAVACDGRTNRKNAWLLDSLGLARWCGTNWGSSFFAITDEGKAFIDAEVGGLSARLASAIEARGAAAENTDAVHESATREGDAQ